MVTPLPTGERFEVIHPTRRWFRNPLFLGLWVGGPVLWGSLVWWTREDVGRAPGYWLVIAPFDVLWTWLAIRLYRGSGDPTRNFVELTEYSLEVRLFDLPKKSIPYDSVSDILVTPGAGTRAWFPLARSPASRHVVLRTDEANWFPLWKDVWRSRDFPIAVRDVDAVAAALRDKLRGRGNYISDTR